MWLLYGLLRPYPGVNLAEKLKAFLSGYKASGLGRGPDSEPCWEGRLGALLGGLLGAMLGGLLGGPSERLAGRPYTVKLTGRTGPGIGTSSISHYEYH